MKKMMGLVWTNYTDGDFGLLTEERPIAAIPYGGRYRLVDFPLSNMVNSGIRTVGLITPYLYRSLLDHVGNGKEWALNRKVGGLYFLPGSTYGMRGATGRFLLRDIIHNSAYLERAHEELVVISAASKIFNIDFTEVAKAHEATGAGITLVYKKVSSGAPGKNLDLELDANGRVTELKKDGTGDTNLFLDALIIDKSLMSRIIDWYAAQSYLDLMDVVAENLNQLSVYGYEFTGYEHSIDNVVDYMDASMELLNPAVIKELFMSDRIIITKVHDAPPVKYGPNADVENSVIATGTIVKGVVENSIIFRGCKIGEGTVIKNSVILPNCVIDEGVYVENVICDKFVKLSDGVKLHGTNVKPLVVTRKQYS